MSQIATELMRTMDYVVQSETGIGSVRIFVSLFRMPHVFIYQLCISEYVHRLHVEQLVCELIKPIQEVAGTD